MVFGHTKREPSKLIEAVSGGWPKIISQPEVPVPVQQEMEKAFSH
jgi:hypothetical protein